MGPFDGISLTPGDFGKDASSHTILTASQLESLFPTTQEKQGFRDLMNAVSAAAQSDQGESVFTAQVGQFGGVILKLLRVLLPV
jgi:hypothetical protein